LANLPIPNHIAIWLVVSSLPLENEEDDCPKIIPELYVSFQIFLLAKKSPVLKYRTLSSLK